MPIENVTQMLSRLMRLDVHSVEPIRPGAWSTVYGFEADSEQLIARFSHYREDFDRDAWAARWASPQLPIPRIIHIEPVDDKFVCVSERVPGTPLDDLDGTGMRAMLPEILSMLDALRLIDTSRTTGAGGWNSDGSGHHPSWHAWIESVWTDVPTGRGANWRASLASSRFGVAPFERVWREIEALLPMIPERRDVVHEDLLNFNVLVDEGKISGVFDWGCGMYGDHLYDVAWFAFWAPWYPQWDSIDFTTEFRAGFERAGADLENFEVRILAYMLHIAMCHMRYYATVERWDDMTTLNQRTDVLMREGIHARFTVPA